MHSEVKEKTNDYCDDDTTGDCSDNLPRWAKEPLGAMTWEDKYEILWTMYLDNGTRSMAKQERMEAAVSEAKKIAVDRLGPTEAQSLFRGILCS